MAAANIVRELEAASRRRCNCSIAVLGRRARFAGVQLINKRIRKGGRFELEQAEVDPLLYSMKHDGITAL